MLTAGVDIGSVATKAVLLEDRRALSVWVCPTGSRPGDAAERSLNAALEAAGKTREDVNGIASTGYGRRVIEFGNHTLTEISAAAAGSAFFSEHGARIQTVIDLGGQDLKLIRLDAGGQVDDFIMNDKCAAGTGRFLEVMAHALEVHLEELGPLALRAERAASINATCAVFAESEVVSLLAGHVPKEEIAAGIHRTVAERIVAMAGKIGLREAVMFCGGGALNTGMIRALEQALGRSVYIPQRPQYINALGAAVAAAARL